MEEGPVGSRTPVDSELGHIPTQVLRMGEWEHGGMGAWENENGKGKNGRLETKW